MADYNPFSLPGPHAYQQLDEFGDAIVMDAAGHRLHTPVPSQEWWDQQRRALDAELAAERKRNVSMKAAVAPPKPSLTEQWRDTRQRFITSFDWNQDAYDAMLASVRSEYAAVYDDQAAADLAADRAKDSPAPVQQPRRDKVGIVLLPGAVTFMVAMLALLIWGLGEWAHAW